MTHNATIHDLPDDVLLLIFKAVYSMSRKYPGRDNRSVSIFEADKDDVIWQDEAVTSPSNLFPDSLVPVSRLWKDTLSSVSDFWTRLTIFVDRRPTPLSAIISRLALSGERVLEITLTRRQGSWSGTDLSEQARVNAAIALLSVHMSRWKTLRLDVLHSSSVLRPHVAMHGDAANLVDLRLHSRLKDAPLLAYWSPLVIQATDDSIACLRRTSSRPIAGSISKPDHRLPSLRIDVTSINSFALPGCQSCSWTASSFLLRILTRQSRGCPSGN
ncbi:hypothetical protein SCP_0505060 [Sparassis crispa]|uniref:Uncharacterized protein n=1 Tax=Sparassis crispa TaxID=139825 RepID=A0A401GMK4_9APHY|nr:hypothetical protein SCP_0505060 [Sparassis crispa]GBE83457.1 hypothetical protein SCP_0505060 [Sparassis crispa]